MAPPKFEFIPAREHGAVLPAAEAKLGELWRLLGAQRGRDGTLTYNPACNESSLVWTKGIKGDAVENEKQRFCIFKRFSFPDDAELRTVAEAVS